MIFHFSVRVAATCGLFLIFGNSQNALAQIEKSGKPFQKMALPAAQQRFNQNAAPLNSNASAAVQLPPLTREQRQQAYAKLLEGQRYLWSLQNLRTQNSFVTNGRLARAALQKCVELNPGLAEGYTALAELAFFTQNNFVESERLAGIAIKLDANNFGSRQLLARIYSSQSGVFNSSPDKTAIDNAIAQWREVARLDPRNAEAWAFLSDFYENTGENEKQLEALRKWGAAANSSDDRFYRAVTRKETLAPEAAAVGLGKILLKNNQPAEALAILSRAIMAEPENLDSVAVFKNALEKAAPEESAKAIGALQEAITANPASPVLIDLLANLQIRAGRLDEAAKLLTTARKRFPENSNLLQLEARILTETNRVDEAVALLRSKIVNKTNQIAVAETLENDFLLNITVSRLFLQAGRGQDAVLAAQQALSLANNSQMTNIAMLTIATAQNAAGDFKAAEFSLREVLKQNPNNAMALNNLGYFLIERNERLPEAMELIKQAVASEPTNPNYLDSLGWANFKLGQITEAEKNLTEAAQLAPNSAAIQHHLGDLYNQKGETEKARNAWRKALSSEKDRGAIEKLKNKLGESKKVKK